MPSLKCFLTWTPAKADRAIRQAVFNNLRGSSADIREEAIQQSWVVLLRLAKRADRELDYPEHWVSRVTEHEARRVAVARHQMLDNWAGGLDVADLAGYSIDPLDHWKWNLLFRLISDDERHYIRLALQGLTLEQIALAQRCSRSTVYRIREILRDLILSIEGDDDDPPHRPRGRKRSVPRSTSKAPEVRARRFARAARRRFSGLLTLPAFNRFIVEACETIRVSQTREVCSTLWRIGHTSGWQVGAFRREHHGGALRELNRLQEHSIPPLRKEWTQRFATWQADSIAFPAAAGVRSPTIHAGSCELAAADNLKLAMELAGTFSALQLLLVSGLVPPETFTCRSAWRVRISETSNPFGLNALVKELNGLELDIGLRTLGHPSWCMIPKPPEGPAKTILRALPKLATPVRQVAPRMVQSTFMFGRATLRTPFLSIPAEARAGT